MTLGSCAVVLTALLLVFYKYFNMTRQQVLLNLLSNAIRFTPESGTVHPRPDIMMRFSWTSECRS